MAGIMTHGPKKKVTEDRQTDKVHHILSNCFFSDFICNPSFYSITTTMSFLF